MAQSENLSIGRGEFWFAKFKPGTQIPGGERWVGNTPEASMGTEVEKLDHFSSSEGYRNKDESVPIETTRTLTISTDDNSFENVSVFSMGIASKIAVSATTDVEETLTDVEVGLTYQLGVSDAAPEGVRKLTEVTLAKGATNYVLNTDYSVDLERGRVMLLEGGAIVAGDDLEATYSGAAYSIQRVAAGEQEVEGQLRFISKAPKGPRTDYLWPRVKLGPNGDLNLITEEWSTIPIRGEILTKAGREPYYATSQPSVA